MVTEFSNTVEGNFKGRVSLIQILLGAGEITRLGQIFHAHHLELRLGLHSILVYQWHIACCFLRCHFSFDLLNYSIFLSMRLFCFSLNGFLFSLDAGFSFGFFPEDVSHTSCIVELKRQNSTVLFLKFLGWVHWGANFIFGCTIGNRLVDLNELDTI